MPIEDVFKMWISNRSNFRELNRSLAGKRLERRVPGALSEKLDRDVRSRPLP